MTTEILECGHPPSPHSDFITGYGVHPDGSRHCYACCAEQDKQWMRENDRTSMYLVRGDDRKYKLTNWPGSFEIPVHWVKKGKHNKAGSRYDCRVTFEGREWHFVQYGEFTQVAHGRKLKLRKQ